MPAAGELPHLVVGEVCGPCGPPAFEGVGGAGCLGSPAPGVGLALALTAGWMIFRPVVRRRLTSSTEWTKARDIVRRHGGDTLSYFALRDDKEHWFWNETLIAYAVHNGVCLVSPDPIGPTSQRRAAWRAFRNQRSLAMMASSCVERKRIFEKRWPPRRRRRCRSAFRGSGRRSRTCRPPGSA